MNQIQNPARRAPKHVVMSELKPGEFLLQIGSYEEGSDAFNYELHDAGPSQGLVDVQLPAVLLPFLLGEFGEPSEFTNTNWIMTHLAC